MTQPIPQALAREIQKHTRRPVRRYEINTMHPGHLTINGEEVKVDLISVRSDPSETEYGRTFAVIFEVPQQLPEGA